MKKLHKQQYILVTVIVLCCLLGISAGLLYKQSQKASGIEVSITNYVVVEPKAVNPTVTQDPAMKAHIITVNVTNSSDAIFNLLPSVFFQLVVDGKAYELSPDMGVQNPLQGGEIAVDTNASGEISFHVPSSSQGELQFRTSTNTPWVTITK